jgi:5,10-methylenetetrahydrofolate reductase
VKQVRRPLRHLHPRLARRGLHRRRPRRARGLLATALCTELCTELLEGGVEDLHFYTLNKPHLTRNVVHALGIAPEVSLEKVA